MEAAETPAGSINLCARPLAYSPEPAIGAEIQQLLMFLAIAFGFTWGCWLGTIWIARGAPYELVSTIGQFGPFLAAAVMSLRDGGPQGLRGLLRRIARWRFHPAWYVLAVLIPPATYYASIALKTLVTGGHPPLRPFDVRYDVFANFFVILLIGGPLGEEPGWRGYAMQRLRTLCGRTLGVQVLGVIWALWHLPIWWRAGEFPLKFILLAVVGMMAISVVFAWLYDRTGGSVLVCLLMHASCNTFFILLPREWMYATWVIVAWAVALPILMTERRAESVQVSRT